MPPCNHCTDELQLRCDRAGLCQAYAREQLKQPTPPQPLQRVEPPDEAPDGDYAACHGYGGAA